MKRRYQQDRPPFRSAPPAAPRDLIKVPGRYVVEWGRHTPPRVEFYDSQEQVANRLNALWSDQHTEAQARIATWHDVILHYQRS